MKEASIVDEIVFKAEMRQMYKNIGYDSCLQCLYEMIKGAELLSEVIVEEQRKLLGNK